MSAPFPLPTSAESHGILLVDKPADWTSHDVCAFVRSRFRIPKVGHAGTLDPNATGLLVLLLGRFTRQSADWSACDKDYEGIFELGVETDSHDKQGKIMREASADSITEEAVKQIMRGFTGEIMQMPPMVSAVKHQGKRLYELARKGQTVEREKRPVVVYGWDFLEKTGAHVRFKCSVSKGTYVRTLVHDLGQQLGCGAALAELRRTRCGPFKIENSVTISALKAMQTEDLPARVLLSAASAPKAQPPKILQKIMRVFNGAASFRKNPAKPLVLALGNFDGVHCGHARLLDYVVRQARRIGGRAAVFTFREHPQAILHPAHEPENLQSLEQRLALFREHGIEICFLQKFTRQFAAYSAREFVAKVLVKKLAVREICLGYNARFGRGREGDADLLRELGRKYHFEVCQMEPVTVRGTPVSSTGVREAVRQGDMDLAARLLGRSWSLTGKTRHGAGRGLKLGFPTANLDWHGYVRPAEGVYAVKAQFLKQPARKLTGVANFGLRPTFGQDTQPVLEAYFFDFHGNLYGKRLEIFFVKRLRGEKKFGSVNQLKAQIKKDAHAARLVLKQDEACLKK